MSTKAPKKQDEYRVVVHVSGCVAKKFLAISSEEAMRKLKNMVFQADGLTPKPKMLCAFEWEIPSFGSCKNER